MNESFADRASSEVANILKKHVKSTVFYDESIFEHTPGIETLETEKYIIWYKKATPTATTQPYKYNFTWQD